MSGHRQRKPVKAQSMMDKRFAPLTNRRKTRVGRLPHPMIVVRDLQHDCLTSLDLYLRIHQGIPDREVAVELRKLISGSRHRTKYRLEALSHPDAEAKSGAPRKSVVAKPSREQFELADAFEEAKKTHTYDDAAIAKVQEKRTESASGLRGTCSGPSREQDCEYLRVYQ